MRLQQHQDSPKAEHPLQAVVIADAAEIRFRPMSLVKPRCLLPLANVPLIEYTLEFLAVSGVGEVFIFCKAHSDMIKSYIKTSKWSKPRSSMAIHVYVAPEAFGAGDIIRELDRQSLIQSDFILVSGDIISNMQLEPVVEAHRQRRLENKDAIMTMVMKQAHPQHRTREKGEPSVAVIDPASDQLLYFEVQTTYPPPQKLKIDMDSLKGHDTFQIRNDLIDCQVDICSVDVPALFSENFDYQDIRRDFVEGILGSDLLTKTIHVHVIREEYATRVRSTQLYDSIARDMIARWTFPITPERNLMEGSCYRYLRGNLYKESNVVLSRTCRVESKVVVGAGTEVGDCSVISNSTIGRNCRIGANVTIEGAYIWDNVTIESDCTIVQSIIADHVVIKKGVDIPRGCMISYETIIGPNIRLPPFTKVTKVKPELPAWSDFESGDEHQRHDQDNKQEYDLQQLGAECVGYVWDPRWDEEEEGNEDMRNRLVRIIGCRPSDVAKIELEESDAEESISIASEDSYCMTDGEESENERCCKELEETLLRSITENHEEETAALELNTLKMAFNITFHDLRAACIPVILKCAKDKALDKMDKVLAKWGTLLRRFGNTNKDQLHILKTALNACKSFSNENRIVEHLFSHLIIQFYNADVVEVEAVEEWCEDDDLWATVPAELLVIRKNMRLFVSQVMSESEEDDEDDDSEEEEEESQEE